MTALNPTSPTGLILVLSLAFCLPAAAQYQTPAGPASTTASAAFSAGGAANAPGSAPPPSSDLPLPLKLKLPFPAGHTYEVIQGNHGDYTHTGFNEYAWDFGMPENLPVCAAAAGRVVRVKQDGTGGGPSHDHFKDGNAVVIDHGGGYYSQYLHLAARSALVREGDLVAGGQIIARSGNTGFSSTPHLHFHVQDASGRSLPVRFQDVDGDGIPRPGIKVTSANDGTGTEQYAGQSFLPADAFQSNSILLITRNLPGHLFRGGRDYPVKGRLTGTKASRVAVYFMSASGGKALLTIYAKVDRDGFFETTFDPAEIKEPESDWNPDTSQSNMFSLAIAPVKSDGSFWSNVSVPVCVR